MAFIVSGKTWESYYSLRFNKSRPQYFKIAVDSINEDEAREFVRQKVQKETGWIAKIEKVESVDLKIQDKPVAKIDWDLPWYECNIVAFDTETTGLDYSEDRIVELGFCQYNKETKRFEDPKSFFINDGVPIPQQLIDKGINDITNEMLVGAPTFEGLLDSGEIDDLFGKNTILVCQNRGFDVGHLLASLRRSKRMDAYIPPVVCSMELALHSNLGLKNNKLETLMKHILGDNTPQSHRAGDDAMNCGNVFMALARRHHYFKRPLTVRQFISFFDRNPDI